MALISEYDRIRTSRIIQLAERDCLHAAAFFLVLVKIEVGTHEVFEYTRKLGCVEPSVAENLHESNCLDQVLASLRLEADVD